MREEMATEEEYVAKVQKKYSSVGWLKDVAYFVEMLGRFASWGVVLDYGCSSGELTGMVARRLGVSVIGSDKSDVALRLAREKERGIKFYSLKDILKGKVRYDHVYLHHVLSHIGKGYLEVLRVLVSHLPCGGTLSIVVPNRAFLWCMLPVNLFSGYVGDSTVVDYFSRRKLEKIARQLGVRVMHIEAFGEKVKYLAGVRLPSPRARLLMVCCKGE